jgi:PAS domain S-box-containing protein
MNPTLKSNGSFLRSFLRPDPRTNLTETRFRNLGYLRQLSLLTIVAIIYFAAARLGLTLAFIHENVSPVWPPTGVAIAAVLLLGYRIWPGILLGAFLANLFTPVPIATAGGIAIGNTIEALAALVLLRSLAFHNSFDRARDVFKFVLAALLCTMLSATIGILSLYLGGAASWQNLGELWLTWWLGDTVGALLITPLVLTWSVGSDQLLPRKRYVEGLIVLFLLAGSAMATFGGPFPIPLKYYPLARLTVPFFLWAAFRLSLRGVTLATIIVSVIAVWGTAHGLGPFVSRTPNDSLLLLQMFLGSNAVMFLFLAAAVEERRHSEETLRQGERRLAGNLAVTRILAESPALGDAMPRILRTIGETFDWEVGGMWTPNSDENVLKCLTFWRAPTAKVNKFEDICRELTFAPGIGLPGRVWTTRKPAWIPDVTKDSNFPRAPFAVAEGLHGAFAFPITSGETLLGVMEFFSHEIRKPDAALLQMFTGIGTQIGQFIERRRAEESLLKSQEALRLAHKVARGGTWQWDLATNAVEGSDEYYDLLGLESEQTPSSFEEWSSLVHPEDLPAVLKEHELAIANVRDFGIEFRMLRADGEWRWFNCNGRCIYDADGKPLTMIGITFDVTERRRSEEEREKLFNLEQAARADAEAANRLKDDFLAMLSHELRTPLVAILGWATTVLASPKRDEALTIHALEVIKRNARLQTRIIEDMLDVSRIVAGKLQLDIRPVDLPSIVESAISTVQPSAEAKGIQVRLTLNSAIKQVSGDPQRLQQVVWNLLSNAIKFTPTGGRVEVEIKDLGTEAQIKVSDTGEGIGPEFLPHIFDRFRQADSSTTRRHGGLGLGLAIVRHLVELQNGTVQARSDGEGLGAVFTVTFPVIQTHREPSLQQRLVDNGGYGKNTVTLAGLRILYVEDDFDSREALATALLLYGADVKAVATVREALAALSIWKPDILLSDIGLPDEDGYDLIRKIRDRHPEEGAMIPAIALTGYAGASEHAEALAAGYQKCLVKPIDPDKLAEVIGTFLAKNGNASNSKVRQMQEGKTVVSASNREQQRP